jgi:hypothetical protein
MNKSKTLFAQVMDYVPWEMLERIVKHHRGDFNTRALSCAELFQIKILLKIPHQLHHLIS